MESETFSARIKCNWKLRNNTKCVEVNYTTQRPLRLDRPADSIPVTDEIENSVTAVLFGDATETSFSRMAFPLVYKFLDEDGGHGFITIKLCEERTLPNLRSTVFHMLKWDAEKAGKGKFDGGGWQSSDESTITRLTWHYCDENRRRVDVSIDVLNSNITQKTGDQVFSIMNECMAQCIINRSDNTKFYTATSDNKGPTSQQTISICFSALCIW